MRVALIGPVPPWLGGATPGGVATHQVHLAAGLCAAGTYAPLLATNTSVPRSAWRANAGEAPFPLYRMGRRGRPGRPDAAYLVAVGPRHVARYALHLAFRPHAGSRREVLTNLLWYRRFLAEVRPEVIHVQHPLERCSYVRTVQQLEGWRLPLVVTAHSLFGEHAETDIQSLMVPNLLAADRVVAVGEHIAGQAIGLGVDPRKVRVIRSGVDVARFRPGDRAAARRALGIAEAVPLVLFVGNLEPRKQVDVLLRALAEVRALGREAEVAEVRPTGQGAGLAEVSASGRDAALVVVGSGESAGVQNQTARLRRLAGELGLGSAVRFVGRVADDQLLQYYAAADVFALPSSSEAQGIVALEAMACGLAVVASAVGGLLGTIEDGRTGVLLPPGDVAALAHGLAEVLGNPGRRRSLGAAARQAVEQHFSWQRAVQATLDVYREVVTRM